MIAMLRRRLMSNMAKAKNIATGTVTATVESVGVGGLERHSVLTVSNLDFMPTNVVVVRTEATTRTLLWVWDDTGYRVESNSGATKTVTRSFNANGFVMETTGNFGVNDFFEGTYNYVAWQE